jgi:hypothetical protein
MKRTFNFSELIMAQTDHAMMAVVLEALLTFKQKQIKLSTILMKWRILKWQS